MTFDVSKESFTRSPQQRRPCSKITNASLRHVVSTSVITNFFLAPSSPSPSLSPSWGTGSTFNYCPALTPAHLSMHHVSATHIKKKVSTGISTSTFHSHAIASVVIRRQSRRVSNCPPRGDVLSLDLPLAPLIQPIIPSFLEHLVKPAKQDSR